MRKTILRFFLPVLLIFAMLPAAVVFASYNSDRVVDQAELLTGSEADSLQEKLDTISEKHQCDVVVVTANSLKGKTAQEYADDFFDYNGYGYGSSQSGILMLVAMQERKWAFSTKGEAIYDFTDDGLEYMEEEIVPYLSDGDYAGGFKKFASLCDQFLEKAETGTPYYGNDMPKRSMPLGVTAGIAAGGIGLGFGGTAIMKGQLKSIRYKQAASDYIQNGSFHLTRQADTFLYSHVTKVARPKDENRGGGHSSTHTSSSGSSHGGRSGGF